MIQAILQHIITTYQAKRRGRLSTLRHLIQGYLFAIIVIWLVAYSDNTIIIIAGMLLFLMTLWYIAALWGQRLHDFGLGHRWAWAFMALHFCAKGVPVLWVPLLILYVVVLLIPGTNGVNAYGPPAE